MLIVATEKKVVKNLEDTTRINNQFPHKLSDLPLSDNMTFAPHSMR